MITKLNYWRCDIINLNKTILTRAHAGNIFIVWMYNNVLQIYMYTTDKWN